MITTQKIKILKKLKKSPKISSFYTSVPKIMIIYYTVYTVPEIWCVTDVIDIFYIGLFFILPPPLQQPKKSKLKKNKKCSLEITSFETSVQKIMIICYTVPEIWHVTDVIFIFHFLLVCFVLFFLFFLFFCCCCCYCCFFDKKKIPEISGLVTKVLFIWKWAGPASRAGSPRWDLTFLKKLL